MINNIKFKGESGLFMIPNTNYKSLTDVKVGELYLVRDRLCLVLEISENKVKWQRRVLMRWVDSEDKYWVSYYIFSELVKEPSDNLKTK